VNSFLRRHAFLASTFVAILVPASSTVPSPIYVVYQERWGLSTAMTTVVFSTYCFAVLASMLMFGWLPDVVGRRPVLLAAVAVVAASTVLFVCASGTAWLLAARAVQGLGVGLGSCAVSAMLIELAPPRRPWLGPLLAGMAPVAGIGAGALLAGELVEHAPAPTVLSYVVLLLAVLAAGWCVAVLPETGTRAAAPPARLFAPRRISVPDEVRRPFAILALPVVAVWAVGGLYLALGPMLAADLVDTERRSVGGVVIALLAGSGVLAQAWCRRFPDRPALRVGCGLLLAGLAQVVLALATGSESLFFTGTAVLGVGWGAACLASFRLITALAGPHCRGELLAAVNVVSYLGTSLPTLAVGALTDRIGLFPATVVLAAAVAAVVVLAAGSLRLVPDQGVQDQSRADLRAATPPPARRVRFVIKR